MSSGFRNRTRILVVTVSLVVSVLGPTVAAAPAFAAAGDITTVAGGGSPPDGVGDGLPAVEAALRRPWGVDEASGELFVSEEFGRRVRRVDGAGVIGTLAGGTVPLGDGGPATAATLELPDGVALDVAGNLFIADSGHHRIRRVDSASGVITTVVGTGDQGFAGDGGPAGEAQLNQPLRVAFDSGGGMFVSDQENSRVRRVNPGGDGLVTGGAGETISTVAGDGSAASGGDGLPATSAQVVPRGIGVDADNNLYIADVGDPRVRRVAAGADGVVDGDLDETISTFAGGGILLPGADGEGALATDVAIGFPEGLTFDASGSLYVATVVDYRVLKVDTTGHLLTVAGNGTFDFGPGGVGDGGPATDAQISFGFGVAVDASNNLFVGELNSPRVRRVVPGADGELNGAADDIITTFAGDGTFAFGGDGGPATQAQLNRAADVAASSGDVYIADEGNGRIRKVDPSGTITTVAGGGNGDGLAATSAVLSRPRGVVADDAGNVLIADCGQQRVRKVDPAGVISTYAGGLVPFRCPSGLHLVSSGPAAGTLYVADAGSHQVLRVDPGGAVAIVAGTGTPGFSGDGSAATAAQLNAPAGVFVDASGAIFVADTHNHRVRRIDPATGRIVTVAGNGSVGFGRDGTRAIRTSLTDPTDIVLDASGRLIIAESGFHRLRQVIPGPDGIVNGKKGEQISTIAGSGVPSFSGEGGPATGALVNIPTQLDLDDVGSVFLTDLGNDLVRRIEGGTPAPPPADGCGQVITKSTTLMADIGPCPGDGIVVGAGGITLDLNGYTIFGTDGPSGGVGVKVESRRNVTIKGRSGKGKAVVKGAVSGFDAGVAIVGGGGHEVRDLQVRDNIGFGAYGDGIVVFFSTRNRILNNVLDGNGIYDGIGILGVGSHENVVRGNLVARTTGQDEPPPVGIGIALNPFVSDVLPREVSIFGNRIEDNIVTENDNAGISNISNVNGVITGNVVENNGLGTDIFPGNGIGVQSLEFANRDTNVVVEGNSVIGNGLNSFLGDGINITSNSNRVAVNQVHGNYGSGISVVGQTNHILDNDAADNGLNPDVFGFDLLDQNFDPDLFEPSCDANVWSGNIWGTAGFFPDCAGGAAADSGSGSEAATTAAAATAATAAERTQPSPSPTPKYEDMRRGHPPKPG